MPVRRFLLLFFLFVPGLISFTQERCKDAKDISFLERPGRLHTAERLEGSAASNNFDVTYYRCEWEADPAIRFIAGKVTIYYRMTSASSSISLDLMNGFTIDSIKQRNIHLARLYTSNVLQANFPAQVTAGVVDSISIYYRGVPPNTGFGSFVQTQHNGVPVLWSLSEPYGSRDWWPCKNGLDDKADSVDIFITSPAAYKAASNGLLQNELLSAGGTKRTAWWKHRYPIATYLVCFAVTNYAVFNNTVQLSATSLPVQTYCYPESQASFQANTVNVLNALQLFHNRFGDYPFIKEKYGHVQFSWGGGMEHQTASFIVNSDEGLMAHELAHQWFGDKVTCGSWEDIWLNEGFATHLTSIYMEEKYPASAINNRKNEIADITSQPGGSVWVDDTNSVGRIFDWRLSYLKGSHLLYMLRWITGDSVFYKASREYLADPRLSYGFARTNDLRRYFEKHAGHDLGYFFTQWFKGQGYPSYHVEWSMMGSSHVKIKMNQTSSHPSVAFFELPVTLRFKNATAQKTIVVNNTKNGEIFIRSLGFTPDTVLVDPEYWLISRNNRSNKITETVNGPNLLQVFPNPVKDRFYAWLRNFSTSMASLSLYNSAGQQVWARSIPLLNGSEFVEIPSQQLASGVYFLHLRTENGVHITRKVLR